MARQKILLIEDDKVDQMAFKRLKDDAKFEYDFAIAGSLSEAKQLLASETFDVIVTDYLLGDGTGLEVLTFIQEIPVVITTGSGDEETAVKAMRAGAFDYLVKDPERNYLKVLGLTVENAIRRKKIEDRLRMLSHAIMNIQDSVYITDTTGKIVFVNKGFCDTYRYSEDDVLGKSTEFLFADSKSPKEAEAGGVKEVAHLRKDGETFPVSLATSIIKDDRDAAMAVVGIARDITEHKRMEVMRVAKEAAEEASRAKSRFLANMSHELRTPLNAIIGYSGMLKEEMEDIGRNDLLPDIGKVQNAAGNLLTLISDILEISKIDAGMLTLDTDDIDVASLVQDVVNKIQPMAAKNNNRLDVHVPSDLGRMRTDPGKVQKVLENVLSNACKFTENGTVEFEVRKQVSNEKEWISFRVTDTGVGMAPEQILRIFEAFTQADESSTRKHGGTGLGLAIAKRFCKMLGGDITVTSKPNAGSTFLITLPVG